MTDHVAPSTNSTTRSAEVAPGDRPSILRVLRDQRKTLVLAAALVVATFWVAGQLGEWRLAACIGGGIALGLVNHIVTEYWLMKIIASGEQPTRNKMIASTMTGLPLLKELKNS